MTGPGSGKTHTLTLRVAKLVYYKHANPEEILVLAYNRAVVSELKDRLGKLFRELGFGNLSNRIKIYTFHGLAKKYAQEQVTNLDFNEWEPELLKNLQNSPGSIMNQLSPLKHILVDEFQDINEVRMDILNKLTEITQAFLFIIGDPNQSIYGYDRDYMDPYHYYEDFNERFTPKQFQLIRNHRSYPDILDIASKVLPDRQDFLKLEAIHSPDNTYMKEYVQVYDCLNTNIKWWEKLPVLLSEKIPQTLEEATQPYRQIAILFRTNNEVYRGFQKIQSMKLPNIRIRIQGNLPYEFTRIRECHAIIELLKQQTGHPIQPNFKTEFNSKINDLIDKNPNWNHFYLHVIHALVLEYLDEQDEVQTYEKLLEFIEEMSYKDDGQLCKIYEKCQNELNITTRETEIVLTTMHKVKGLEFDCVVIPPSFSNLPLAGNDNELQEQLDEEKRLTFVSFTRAKYRLLIFRREREFALLKNQPYSIPDDENRLLGIPMQAGIDKLNIGWAANSYNFNRGINNHIRKAIKSGDSLVIKKKDICHDGNNFSVYELYKENNDKPIGELAGKTALALGFHQEISGFVVNEVVVWSYEDTCKSDEKTIQTTPSNGVRKQKNKDISIW